MGFIGYLKKTSVIEIYDIVVAWICLSLAFAISFGGGLIRSPDIIDKISINNFFLYFSIAVITIGISFVLHELAHKYVAIFYGHWAEFRKDMFMLLTALVTSVLAGIIFAVPGATYIVAQDHDITKKENGVISLAGPLTNIILVIPFLLLIIVVIHCIKADISDLD
ncbi:MAG TPA: hypothetical protein O0X14_01460, partial [Methanocorpusculum sp.]|nr:hypothetical protein [Methanocorpusculum sp.]